MKGLRLEKNLGSQTLVCSLPDCDQPATEDTPTPFCQTHFDEWDLWDAQNEADTACKRLASVQKRIHQNKTLEQLQHEHLQSLLP